MRCNACERITILAFASEPFGDVEAVEITEATARDAQAPGDSERKNINKIEQE